MNISTSNIAGQADRPLTRADVEKRLQAAGSSDKLSLSHQNLQDIDLRKMPLHRADLSGADLSGADLSEADLRYADLSGANLSEADLRYADLSGAYLYSANLSGANLSEANLSETILSEADLSGANLSGANLSEADLDEVILSGAILSGAILSETGLRYDHLYNAALSQANFLRTIGVNLPKEIAASDTPTFRIRIMEEPLTPYNLSTILSAISDLSTKCWLIAHERFADLIEYTQTHDVRFVEETQLHITKLTHNSPLDGSFKLDLSASNIAEAIVTAIDGATQVKSRLEKAKLENEAKAQEIEQRKQKAEQISKEAILELERKEFANERERLEILEKRLDVQKKGIEYALEIASKTIAVLHPNADEQMKAMLIQNLLPSILQLQSSKGLELILPPPQNTTEEQK